MKKPGKRVGDPRLKTKLQTMQCHNFLYETLGVKYSMAKLHIELRPPSEHEDRRSIRGDDGRVKFYWHDRVTGQVRWDCTDGAEFSVTLLPNADRCLNGFLMFTYLAEKHLLDILLHGCTCHDMHNKESLAFGRVPELEINEYLFAALEMHNKGPWGCDKNNS